MPPAQSLSKTGLQRALDRVDVNGGLADAQIGDLTAQGAKDLVISTGGGISDVGIPLQRGAQTAFLIEALLGSLGGCNPLVGPVRAHTREVLAPELGIVRPHERVGDAGPETKVEIGVEVRRRAPILCRRQAAGAGGTQHRIGKLGEVLLKWIGNPRSSDKAPRIATLLLHWQGVEYQPPDRFMRGME